MSHSKVSFPARAFSVTGALALVAALVLPGSALAADAKIDLAAGKKIAAQVCSACHGADGNSPSPANPKLAGQHDAYLVKQLNNFRKQPDASAAERSNAIMAGFAASLSDADIRNVSAYFAGQTLKPAAAKEKDLAAIGQKIYRAGIASKGVPACAACHGPTGAGLPAQYPALAGQYASYTAAQLTAFRQGERGNSEQMRTIAERMLDTEIKAVSDYIAGLR